MDETVNLNEDSGVQYKEVTDVVGKMTAWHKRILFGNLAVRFVGPFHILSTVFVLAEVPFRCIDNNSQLTNNSHFGVGNMTYSKNECWTSNTTACQKWEYDHSVFSSTLTEKFNLVCDRSWLISLGRSTYMIGVLFSCLFIGYLADKIGRKPVLWIGLVILFAADCLNLYAPNFQVYAVSNILSGFGRIGALTGVFVIMLETLATEHRSRFGITVSLGFIIGYVIFPGVAYLLRDWFYLHLVNACLAALLLGAAWITPESPRWLIINNKLDSAENVLLHAAKINGKNLANVKTAVQQLAFNMNASNSEGNKVSALELFRTPRMRKNTIILFFVWFVVSFLYYGFSFNVEGIGGNVFYSLFIFGVLFLPTPFVTAWSMNYFGRKKTTIITMIACSFTSFGMIPLTTAKLWLRMTLAASGSTMVACCFESIFIYTTEIYPTNLRTIGLTACCFVSRVGSILAPFMKELGRSNNFFLPLCLFGGLSIVSAGVTFFLPETRNVALPDTVLEAERLGTETSVRKDKDKKSWFQNLKCF